MYDNYQSEFRDFVGNQETLLWTDRPKQGFFLKQTDVFMIPFSLAWGGFAIFWEATVITMDAPLLFKLWGIPFVVIGLYLIGGRFFHDWLKRSKTFYGITEDRILIKSGLFKSSIFSINIKNISSINFSEKSDRTGSIFIGTANGQISTNFGGSKNNTYKPPTLELIENVREVYDKIIQLQKDK